MVEASASEPSVATPVGFRRAMRRLASGVGIVTVIGPDGPAGLVATSITSLAMDPASLLVCVNRQASLHACLVPGARFCVNLLSVRQRRVAEAFGGAVARAQRFTVGDWTRDAYGVPALESAQASISCQVDRLIAYGTHTIVIGQVGEVRLAGEVEPLIYQDGLYL